VPEAPQVTGIDSHRSVGPDVPEAAGQTDPRPSIGTRPRARPITCIVFTTLRHSGQRALVDDDVTDNMLV
jgi:hypothetical protein